jgi:hypothetical protein
MTYIFKLIKVLAWASFIIFCLYILLSAVFFFVGLDQFYSFQNYVISFPFLIAVPALLLVSLLAGKFEPEEEF